MKYRIDIAPIIVDGPEDGLDEESIAEYIGNQIHEGEIELIITELPNG